MEKLEKEYDGKAAIVFIDVWKLREQGPKFGIRAISTQIFYDRNGSEVYRHEGFMDKATVVAMLNKLGVELLGEESNSHEQVQRPPYGSCRCSFGCCGRNEKIHSLFTLDHKDCSLYRPSNVKRLELIPHQLS